MRRFWFFICLVAAAVVLPGCFERVETITLNPDGSGRSQLDFYFDPATLDPAMAGFPPQALARLRVKEFIQGARGVDAWKDVSFEPMSDGRIHLKATVYFKNLARYPWEPLGILQFDWHKDHGGMTLLVSKGILKSDPPPAGHAAPGDKQVAAQIKAYRELWETEKAKVALARKVKLDVTFILPGKLDGATVFERTPSGVRFVFDGGKFIDIMEARMKDDAILAADARAGESLDNPSDEHLNQVLYGQRGVMRAHVTGNVAPLFDYAAEAGAARKAQPGMLRELGLDDGDRAPTLDTPLLPTTLPGM